MQKRPLGVLRVFVVIGKVFVHLFLATFVLFKKIDLKAHFDNILKRVHPIAKELGKVLLTLLSILGGISAILFIISILRPKPDLYISEITWYPREPWPGQKTVVCLQVKNQGRIGASSFLVELRANTSVMSAFVPGVAKESMREVCMTWKPDKIGENTFWAVLDPYNIITETDEQNNKRAVTFKVKQPPVLINPSGIRYSLKQGQDILAEFIIDWRGNPKQEIGFEIRQTPKIENGGVSVGSPTSEGKVTVTVSTGEETPPGYYLIEILTENSKGNLLGTFQIELFVEAQI